MRPELRALVLLGAALAACGKKGPPLAPIILVPSGPGEFAAARRGDTVQVEFLVPSTNTDGSSPANVSRVEVYGYTGPQEVSDADVLRLGTRIATLDVNEPPDPERPGPEGSMAAPKSGVDQGARVRVTDVVSADMLIPLAVGTAPTTVASSPETPSPTTPNPAAPSAETPNPQAPSAVPEGTPGAATMPRVDGPPESQVPVRTYAAVASAGRRMSPLSRRGVVPLVPAPEGPALREPSYDESAVHVAWTSTGDEATIAYHVYEVGRGSSGTPADERRLTTAPIMETTFSDARIEWDATRCYTVRSVRSAHGGVVESDAPPPACVTMEDTFAPAAPSGLTAVSSAGAVSLIWDATAAADLAGYLVLKGPPGGPLAPVTPAPIPETTFRDAVAPGTRVAYAVQAVDKAGNVSAASATVEETSR